MHFPIIKLEPVGLAREDWDIDLGYEDSTLNEHTDYYGDIYHADERRQVIESDWLKELLDGIATIDTEKETITFCDLPTIKNTLYDYYIQKVQVLSEAASQLDLSGYDFRDAGYHFRGFYTLFMEDYGKTSMDFVEDAPYYAGETRQIGNIFDAHF